MVLLQRRAMLRTMSSLLLAPALGAIDPTCKDTPDWQNPYGKRCDDYRVLAYCAQGHVMRGQEWTVGADYKHPEQNCCVCGKGYVAPAPAQALERPHAAVAS